MSALTTTDRETNVLDITWRPTGASELVMDRYEADTAGYEGRGTIDELEERVIATVRDAYKGRGQVLQISYISVDLGDDESFGRTFWQDPSFKPRARRSR